MNVYFAAKLADERNRRRPNEPAAGQPAIQNQIPMGDRSPKSAQKQAAQKQAKTDVVAEQKQRLITSQQATKAKAAANKRK